MTYLANVTLAVIGTPSPEVLQQIEESVKNGGGIFEKGGVTNETTHAILVDHQVKNIHIIQYLIDKIC